MLSNKGALALICVYGEDSSDDEVPGPRVSTKRVHKDDSDDDPDKVKRKEKLPVPAELLKSNNDNEVMDEPSLHDGRIRSFPHERGNWATYVYIPYEQDTTGMLELIQKIKNIIPMDIELKEVDDFHISLTKTVVLKHHWIQPFVDSVKQHTIHKKRFMIMFDSFKIYCNEERTRTFIGLTVKTGFDSLMQLVEILDKCLVEYKLPTFYQDPSFHMSIAWIVGDVEEELNKYISEMNSIFNQLISVYSQENWYIYVNYLLCKSGNKTFQFNLC